MKHLLIALSFAFCFASTADAQIFKRRVCTSNCQQQQRHHYVQNVRYTNQAAIAMNRSTSVRTRAVPVGCQDERAAWEEADQAATQSLVAREAAKNDVQEANAQLEAARAALVAAEQAQATAVAALGAAQQEVDAATTAAAEAYTAYIQCIR